MKLLHSKHFWRSARRDIRVEYPVARSILALQEILQTAVPCCDIFPAIVKTVRHEAIENRMKKRLKLKKITIRDLDDNSLETVVGADVSNTCLNCPPPSNQCVTPFTGCATCGGICTVSCASCHVSCPGMTCSTGCDTNFCC